MFFRCFFVLCACRFLNASFLQVLNHFVFARRFVSFFRIYILDEPKSNPKMFFMPTIYFMVLLYLICKHKKIYRKIQ